MDDGHQAEQLQERSNPSGIATSSGVTILPTLRVTINRMLSRYIHEAMKRARYKTLEDGTCFGQITGIAGVWANERTPDLCQEVLQEVLEEWLILKIRDHDLIARLGRIGLPVKAA